jgi:hypothetical protein
MLEFNGNDMTLTRGDTVYIDTVILTPLGIIYEPKEGDIITFSIYYNGDKGAIGFKQVPIIQKQFVDRKLKLEAKDTAYLSKGTYEYKCVIACEEKEMKETYCQGKFILK